MSPKALSVMSSTRRTEIPARYISIKASSNAALAALVPFDDGRLEGLPAQLGYLKLHRTGLGIQRPPITPRPRILSAPRYARTCRLRTIGRPPRPASHSACPRRYRAPISPRWSRIRASSICITCPIGLAFSLLSILCSLSASLQGALITVKCAKDILCYRPGMSTARPSNWVRASAREIDAYGILRIVFCAERKNVSQVRVNFIFPLLEIETI